MRKKFSELSNGDMFMALGSKVFGPEVFGVKLRPKGKYLELDLETGKGPALNVAHPDREVVQLVNVPKRKHAPYEV